jgi:hypothetical protein
MAHSAPLPFVLEDRTGLLAATDFDDMYDRVFLRVARASHPATILIYKMNQRASRRRDSLPLQAKPTATLQFGPSNSLGTLYYVGKAVVPMSQYLRKTSLFGG